MDPVKRCAVYTPKKSNLALRFAKALLKRIQKTKSLENTKKDTSKNTKIPSSSFANEDIEKAFLCKLFGNISAVKAAYAQLQFAQLPYDADEIQSADQIIVSELKKLSELKQQRYMNEIIICPEKTQLLSEIQELNSLVITHRITTKKLDSQLKLKDSEITFLKEKLAEANSDNDLLEKRLNLENTELLLLLSGLMPSHFIAYFKQAIKSTRSFVRLLISEMEFANWDLESPANSIQPGVFFSKTSHICYAFESFVWREMFDDFDYPNFKLFQTDYLAWKAAAKSKFCRDKYLRLMHPKMEKSIFGNLDLRDLASSGEFPETAFSLAFCEMAKDIWLLNCLALSFNHLVSIFQVSKNSRFSEVYMESLNDEAFVSCDATVPVRVAFTVVPGFIIGKTVVQCQVYLG